MKTKKIFSKRNILITLAIIFSLLICYSLYFCYLSYEIVKNINQSSSYKAFQSSEYSKYIKDEYDYDRMHFCENKPNTDEKYYGIYIAIPLWNKVTVYHYYIHEVRDKNGHILSGGGDLFDPCKTRIEYFYENNHIVINESEEYIESAWQNKY
ncbi:hypothetical protein [Ruminococcus bovis]|uniref:DUF3139 domain-containing protein n=1 Tax=Ruminococcus bovis TaxID=2564099 RepID=A0A4P8XTE0_9FIRM|nr:hypothetical protein [Ruminococcus bovis]QCT06221.1 hypothetical protein E5Z56_02040 [Ruminococcus bovis]